jgi:nicotinamidase-related amidase
MTKTGNCLFSEKLLGDGGALVNAYTGFLKREECVLFLVDIQKVMLDPCMESAELGKNAAALIDMARLLSIPVVFSAHNTESLGGVLPRLLSKISEPQIYDKLEFSCFENEKIRQALGALGRGTLILAGLETHICIFHTGAHALRLGYTVHVVSDAVSSRANVDKHVGLRRLEKGGAVISSTQMVIYELLNRAGTDEFRAALPLLKTL